MTDRPGNGRRNGREFNMINLAIVAPGAEPADAEACFRLGMVHSAGAGVPVDLIEAHKWFNIAAVRGHREAAQLRREVADQMADSEIGCAQRAARDWLKKHQPAPVAPIRIAA